MIILDPPKFAHKRDKVDDALMAYHRLNRAAVDLLEPVESWSLAVARAMSNAKTSSTCSPALPNGPAAISKSSNNAVPPRSPGKRDVFGDGVLEVLYLPGGG